MVKKRALICGALGQDGSYLSALLLGKGYEVVGTSRDAQTASLENHRRLGIEGRVQLESMAMHDFRSVLQVVKKVRPDEIYNLSGQSSVGLSFEQPVETLDSVVTATLNLLEVVRFFERPIRLYFAGSGECFGDTGGGSANEETPFRPRSPYAVAKAASCWLVSNYREAYGLHASTGILFNHESPLRPQRYVTRKVVATACRIARGSREKLILGNLSIRRDWGWAEEYVDAMWRMLQQETGADFVIATGESHALSDFVVRVFQRLGMDWTQYTETSKELFRPTDISEGRGDPRKASNILSWRPSLRMPEVVDHMVDAELAGSSR